MKKEHLSAEISDQEAKKPKVSGSLGAALSQSSFRLVLYASGFSLCAFWMTDVACSWLMREMTDADPFMTSLVQLALQLPVTLVLLPAGVLTDLMDRVQLFLFAQALMVASTSALFLFYMSGSLSPVGLLALISILGVGSALRMPNVSATVSDIVPRAQLTAALSLTTAVVNGSRMVGPAIAALILAFAGVGGVLGVNLVMLLIATALLRQLPSPPRQQVGVRWPLFKTAFMDGFRMMAASRQQRGLLIMTAFFAGSLAVIVALLPVMFSTRALYGMMYACFGAGAMAGAVSMAMLRSNAALGTILHVGIAASAAALFVLAVWAHPVARAISLFVAGVSWVAVLNASQVYAALDLDATQRGRGLSFLYMAAIGGMALASPFWGWLAKTFSIQTSLLIASIVSGCLLFAFQFRQARHQA